MVKVQDLEGLLALEDQVESWLPLESTFLNPLEAEIRRLSETTCQHFQLASMYFRHPRSNNSKNPSLFVWLWSLCDLVGYMMRLDFLQECCLRTLLTSLSLSPLGSCRQKSLFFPFASTHSTLFPPTLLIIPLSFLSLSLCSSHNHHPSLGDTLPQSHAHTHTRIHSPQLMNQASFPIGLGLTAAAHVYLSNLCWRKTAKYQHRYLSHHQRYKTHIRSLARHDLETLSSLIQLLDANIKNIDQLLLEYPGRPPKSELRSISVGKDLALSFLVFLFFSWLFCFGICRLFIYLVYAFIN